MTFTQEQRSAVEVGGNVVMKIDGIDCAVLRADVFEKVREVLAEELSHDDLRATLARSFTSSDWNDPAMDIYNNYDQHK